MRQSGVSGLTKRLGTMVWFSDRPIRNGCYHTRDGGVLQVGLDWALGSGWASLGLPQGNVNDWDFVA
jgi:hypothetical protein